MRKYARDFNYSMHARLKMSIIPQYLIKTLATQLSCRENLLTHILLIHT
ncbi:unnamed protein product [Blumeria hordei]|uniref:Uncharacterized protein n=1 Tax=Blumeria hordei TaxID=2867405 RepID=A0A383UR37_BLUHO|nr:unnamed protein product [Blumeria hordei]